MITDEAAVRGQSISLNNKRGLKGMNQWWYEKDGVATGPIDKETMQSMFLSGALAKETLIWSNGMPAWLSISDVGEFSFPPPLPHFETHKHSMQQSKKNDYPVINDSIVGGGDNKKAVEYNDFEKSFIKSQYQKKDQKNKDSLGALIKLSFLIAVTYVAGMLGGVVAAAISTLSCIVIIAAVERHADKNRAVIGNSENTSDGNKNTTIKIALFILMVIAAVMGRDFAKISSKPTNNEINSLKNLAGTLPIMVDDETRWDKLLLSDNIATFEYALVNYKSNEIDKGEFLATVRPAITPGFCRNMAKSIQGGMLVKIKYYGNDNEVVAMFIINPSDCNGINESSGQGAITAPPRPKV
ncbi:DUF4339 domain-containing protein [Aeromonas veronii]